MLIRYGYEITIAADAPLPLIAQMSARPERKLDLRGPERFATDPGVAFSTYLDGYGNFCHRLTAPEGRFTLTSDAVIADHGMPDAEDLTAEEMPIEALPDDVLLYVMPSRYCDSDLMGAVAWETFGSVPRGWRRVQAISDWAHDRLRFDYQRADATRTGYDAFQARTGVCRDFTHLAITACRALNIPARYVNGHLGDIGIPPVPDPMDFCAWMEVYLSGRWWTFDPRNNARRIGRVVLGYGRDAADVALISSFGAHRLEGFKVWCDEVDAAGNVVVQG